MMSVKSSPLRYAFLIMALAIGCSTPEQMQSLSPTVYYRQDICFSYENGEVKEEKIKNFFNRFRSGKYRKTRLVREKIKQCGVAVLPEMDEYIMGVSAPGKLDFFALTSCHEEITSENPDAGWRVKNGTTQFVYSPTIEKGKACPLYLSAYNKNQKHSWGIVMFENTRYTLPAIVSCNGYQESFDGVSVCQSRDGLIQRISFDEPVKLVSPVNGSAGRKEQCPAIGIDSEKSFEFTIPNRECFYGFIGLESGRIHQMLTVGYEEIIVREL